jgi:hypothetical protein
MGSERGDISEIGTIHKASEACWDKEIILPRRGAPLIAGRMVEDAKTRASAEFGLDQLHVLWP